MKLPLKVAAVSGIVALTLLLAPPASERLPNTAFHAPPPASAARQQTNAQPPLQPQPAPLSPQLAHRRPAFSAVHQAMLENFTPPPPPHT
ncbi:MAG: hypothetical protein P8J87_18610, partial [Verrucomicrobiales bacterium]|nr:hypothetical protein [Verrucomicrobiales bacterium]